MKQCPYRKTKFECPNHETGCMICLMGQQIDSIELQTSAIANLCASIEESLSFTHLKNKNSHSLSLKEKREAHEYDP